MCLSAVAAQDLQGPPLRGDADNDGTLNITDAINLLGFLFLGGPAPYCDPAGDTNSDGAINIADPTYLLNFLFSGGPGMSDLTPEELDLCANHPPAVPSRDVYRTYPGEPAELPVGASDPDGDPLRYRVEDFPAGATLDETTGMIRWTPEESQLGPFYLRFSVSDDAIPPASVDGRVVFLVQPPDPCNSPECDPRSGCEATLPPLTEVCCTEEPQMRVPEPEVGCPEGAVLHVGRNTRRGFGRLQNCDRLRTPDLGQGGVGVLVSFEVRCVETFLPVTVRVRLETAAVLLVDEERDWFFWDRADGYGELLSRLFPIPPAESDTIVEGAQADLTVTARDIDGVELRRKLRLVLTKGPLDDLPDVE
jgi:hypothetical protein